MLNWKQTKGDSVLLRYICQPADNRSNIWQSYEPNAAGKTFGAIFAQHGHLCFLAEMRPATARQRRLDRVEKDAVHRFFFRQRRKARAFCLGVTGLVRLSIQQPPPLHAAQ